MIFDGLIGVTGGQPGGGVICACAGTASSAQAAANIADFIKHPSGNGRFRPSIQRNKIALTFNLSRLAD
jgi:hypothetical protein